MATPTGSSDGSRPRVLLGVSGGIAAYKACELLRRFTETGHDVTVVPTRSALNFVGAATWEALSGKPVSSEVFADVPSVQHVRLGQLVDWHVEQGKLAQTFQMLKAAARGTQPELDAEHQKIAG